MGWKDIYGNFVRFDASDDFICLDIFARAYTQQKTKSVYDQIVQHARNEQRPMNRTSFNLLPKKRDDADRFEANMHCEFRAAATALD